MYEVMDSFLARSTWTKRHPIDDEAFCRALFQIVWNDDFHPDVLERYLRMKTGIPADDQTSDRGEAISRYCRAASAIWDFMKFNKIPRP